MAGPKKPVALDLDALEREGDPGPYTFTLGAREYEMADPQSLDYRQLAPLLVAAQNGDVVATVNGLLKPDDVKPFWENRLPAFKLEALADSWLDHYGLKPPEKASASSPSSKGTGARSRRTSRSVA